MALTSKGVGFALLLACFGAHAEDWSASGGVSLREASSTQPGAGSTDKGWSGNAMVSKNVDEWTLGGGLSYSLSTIDAAGNTSRSRPAATSVVAVVTRDIGSGRAVSATLGYGRSAVNTSQLSGGTTTSYTSRSNFLSSSIGLTQAVTLSRRSMLILSARYTGIGTRAHSYTDSAGIQTPGSDSNFGFASLGAGFSHRFGRTTAYVQADWNTAGKEFVAGTGDRNYFNINTGLNYRLDAKTNLGLAISTVAGKAYSRDNSIGVNVRYAF